MLSLVAKKKFSEQKELSGGIICILEWKVSSELSYLIIHFSNFFL